jgi:ribulose 1,5-bisphosphate synthetase/thiazole synthase
MQLLSGHPDTADVVMVDAGRTGLMSACELALGGVAVQVHEARAGELRGPIVRGAEVGCSDG